MVVITNPSTVDQLPIPKLHHSMAAHLLPPGIPIVDLHSPAAAAQIVSACEELGFFKLTNHSISVSLMENLEDEAVKFFSLPLWKKDAAGGGGAPSGYGSRRIGHMGDVGWIEYLLLQTNSINPTLSSSLRSALNEYITAVKKLGCDLLELMAEGLGLQPKNALSKLLMDEESDLILRLNHYPPCPVSRDQISGVTGFGEHTDPQVLTNGRFKSVKHRVLTNSLQSRVSMIFFGGPPLKERVAPLPHLMEEGEQSLYREFTWREYKATAFGTKLVDNRLELFEKH